MFLVEPASGRRCHFSSARALGAAIRRGELGPEARIFHQTTSRWLPITVHPEYRKAELEWEESSARKFSGRRWTFLADPAGQDPLEMISPSPAPDPGPILIPGDGEPSWLGSAFRHLLQLARVTH
jgi:hypothetical protein